MLQQLLIIAMALSVVTCALIQKTKHHSPSSDWICLYSLIINIGVGILFCMSFTTVDFPTSLWVGLFSFLGADTLYKSLEGKLKPYEDLVTKPYIQVPKENLIDTDVMK